MKIITPLLLADSVGAVELTIIILSVLFLVGFVFAIVWLLVKNILNDRKFERQLGTSLVVCFDFERNVINVFNSNAVASVRSYSFDKFLGTIKQTDRERISLWLRALREDVPNTPTFLRSSVPMLVQRQANKKDDNTANGLIELNSINDSRTKISVTIHNLSFVPFDQTKWVNNFNSIRRQLSFTLYGSEFPSALYFIKLSLKNDARVVSVVEPVAYTLIVDKLSREASTLLNTELYELDEDLILIVQNTTNPSFNYEEAGKTWLRKVNQIISSNFWNLNIVASVGVITSNVSKQIRTILDEGRKLAISASDNEADGAFASYDSSSKRNGADVAHRVSFAKIVEGKGLTYTYQAILNPSTSRIFAYHTRIKPKVPPFANMTELKAYASRHELTRELLQEYLAGAINEFASITDRTPYTRLFIELQSNEVIDAIELIQEQEKPNGIDVVLVIDEELLSSEEVTGRTFLLNLHNLKQAGCELAIRLENDQFPEYGDLYKRFDFFIPPNIKIDNRSKDENYAPVFYTRLLEKLIVFKKPVVCLSVEGWPRVELLVRLGIDYIGSDDISPYSISQKEIEKRKLIRLSRFAE